MLKLIVSLGLMISSLAIAAPSDPDHIVKRADELVWVTAPNFLPKGAMVAIMFGDSSKDEPFAIRLKFPDGYKIAPHFHPMDENVTVISGELLVGIGHDKSVMKTSLPQAGFAHLKKDMHHFAEAKGETIVQINALGPWGITYVDPADDPRP